ncbi:hypothetical protein [Sphingomonas parapaucimobilis]|uniref:hypothetical protein n=1 Tax=Sphingomonas parapaucimobilis TaxID=28213 RepID=UPI0035C8789C
MQTLTLTEFIANAEVRAVRSGALSHVDAMRNKGGLRTERKRALLARAAARGSQIRSYF